MELRPELIPPVLDGDLVARLARLTDRLDGAPAGERDDELAEFNRLAGTTMPLADFQGIYKSTDPEDFVRSVLFRRAVAPVPDLSRAEMAEIVSRVMACGDDHEFYLQLFLANCKHPRASDLIFWPDLVAELPQDREPTAEEVADVAIGWEPRVVAMQVAKRSGGASVGYFIYALKAPGTPDTQVVTPLDAGHSEGAVLAVALKGARLRDGSTVAENFQFGPWSCGEILGVTDEPIGTRITGHPAAA